MYDPQDIISRSSWRPKHTRTADRGHQVEATLGRMLDCTEARVVLSEQGDKAGQRKT